MHIDQTQVQIERVEHAIERMGVRAGRNSVRGIEEQDEKDLLVMSPACGTATCMPSHLGAQMHQIGPGGDLQQTNAAHNHCSSPGSLRCLRLFATVGCPTGGPPPSRSIELPIGSCWSTGYLLYWVTRRRVIQTPP